jgi:protein-S-isoprenylcysteine O-methyltransferase
MARPRRYDYAWFALCPVDAHRPVLRCARGSWIASHFAKPDGSIRMIFGIDARDVFGALVAVFWVTEWAFNAWMRPGARDRMEDRGSGRWLAVAFPLAWIGAFALVHVPQAAFGTAATLNAGIAVMVVGQIVRWWSIATLGRFFTTYVAIRSGHRVVQSGPYRFVRHPSYTGILLIHLGAALCFGNALSVVALLVPVWWGLANRMRIEEAALAEAFGAEYREYMARTKRLLPGLY